MKNWVGIVILAGTIFNEVNAQPGYYYYDSLSFEQKLYEVTDVSSEGIHIGISNFDSTTSTADIIFQLYLPEKNLRHLLAEFGHSTEKKQKEQRNLQLVFKHVHLKWNDDYHVFFSLDTTLVLYQIGDSIWNQPIQAGIGFDLEEKWCQTTLYLETPDSSQYFFNYRTPTHQMMMYSTDTLFMDAFGKVKANRRELFYARKYQCNRYILWTGSMSRLDKFVAALERYRKGY